MFSSRQGPGSISAPSAMKLAVVAAAIAAAAALTPDDLLPQMTLVQK